MDHYGLAEWNGGLKDGNGVVSTESGALQKAPYSFKKRFENEPGTNPEELIGAAHAGCFSMALAAQLEKEGFKAESIQTRATVSLEKVGDSFSITAIHLDVKAQVARIQGDKFNQVAETAKAGCPVSKLMKAPITLEAELTQ